MEHMHAVQYVAQFHAMNVGIKHITASSFCNLPPITASHQQLLILTRHYITTYNCAQLSKCIKEKQTTTYLYSFNLRANSCTYKVIDRTTIKSIKVKLQGSCNDKQDTTITMKQFQYTHISLFQTSSW
jgi:hypothetical protein